MVNALFVGTWWFSEKGYPLVVLEKFDRTQKLWRYEI